MSRVQVVIPLPEIRLSDIDDLLAREGELRTLKEYVTDWGGDEKKPDGVYTMPFPIYPKPVVDFFHAASGKVWCDRNYNPADAGPLVQNPDFIKSASIDQVRTMLTWCARGERFCDGHWGHVLRTGMLFQLLDRLREIRATIGDRDK